MNKDGRFGYFRKDYSWQERAVATYMETLPKFYSKDPGSFDRAYVVEASPSGGKSTFSMKLARELIVADLIDKVIWVVPRENIKDGFQSDVANLEDLPPQHRLLDSRSLRVDTGLKTSYNGMLANYHGAVITYQSLPTMLGREGDGYFELLSKKYRLMFVLDEAHHGRAEDPDGKDEACGVWAEAMERCRSIACAVVCMTGTPVRADNKRVPYFIYHAITNLHGETIGLKVVPDFSFSYQDAVIAGIARKVICRSQDPNVTYEVENGESGDIETFTRPVSAIPSHHLPWVKNTIFSFDRGIVDHLLQAASEECDRLQRAGDHDAAILVIARRDADVNETKNLAEIKRRIDALFGEAAVTVESKDADSRAAVRNFKKGLAKWIVAKEMITEGTNIPRLRVVLILRDIGNKTFYEQLIHRATRNDADDHLQDAIVIQAKFPNLHDWATQLEEQAQIAIDLRQKRDRGAGGEGEHPAADTIEALFVEPDQEATVIEGDDFTEVDPMGRRLYELLGARTRTSRWQLDMILKEGQKIGLVVTSTETTEETFTIDEKVTRLWDMGLKDCKRTAMNLGGGHEIFRKVIGEAKRSAGIKGKSSAEDLLRDHPNPLQAVEAFYNAAHRAYLRSRLPEDESP